MRKIYTSRIPRSTTGFDASRYRNPFSPKVPAGFLSSSCQGIHFTTLKKIHDKVIHFLTGIRKPMVRICQYAREVINFRKIRLYFRKMKVWMSFRRLFLKHFKM